MLPSTSRTWDWPCFQLDRLSHKVRALTYAGDSIRPACWQLSLRAESPGFSRGEYVNDYMERTGTSARSALEQNSLSKDWRYRKRVDQLLTQLLWLEQNAQSSLSPLLHYIYEYIGYKEFLRTDASEELFEERMESVEELLSLGEQFDTAEDLLEYVEIQMLSYRRNSQSQDAVTLSTIHKSKGLEYHTVFIISCIDGIMPHAEAKDIEEERRMLYVAMTRATDLLELSTIRYFRNRPASVSPFFADMEKQIKVKNAPGLRIED